MRLRTSVQTIAASRAAYRHAPTAAPPIHSSVNGRRAPSAVGSVATRRLWTLSAREPPRGGVSSEYQSCLTFETSHGSAPTRAAPTTEPRGPEQHLAVARRARRPRGEQRRTPEASPTSRAEREPSSSNSRRVGRSSRRSVSRTTARPSTSADAVEAMARVDFQTTYADQTQKAPAPNRAYGSPTVLTPIRHVSRAPTANRNSGTDRRASTLAPVSANTPLSGAVRACRHSLDPSRTH